MHCTGAHDKCPGTISLSSRLASSTTSSSYSSWSTTRDFARGDHFPDPTLPCSGDFGSHGTPSPPSPCYVNLLLTGHTYVRTYAYAVPIDMRRHPHVCPIHPPVRSPAHPLIRRRVCVCICVCMCVRARGGDIHIAVKLKHESERRSCVISSPPPTACVYVPSIPECWVALIFPATSDANFRLEMHVRAGMSSQG